MDMKFNWYNWSHGLVAGIVSSAAGGGLLVMVEPATFNLTTGLVPLVKVITVFAIFGALTYLKSYPTPAPWEAAKPTNGQPQ